MKTIKAKVHRLPTEEGCIAFENDYGFKFIGTTKEGYYKTENQQPHHLYITTDEEIMEGDWVHHKEYGIRHYVNKDLTPEAYKIKGWRKIIATTDPKLTIKTTRLEKITNPGVYEKQLLQIHQSFIEEYCKSGGIDEVLIELKFSHSTLNEGHQYTPKLNPDNTIIIHPVEEKMYSREEVIKLCEDAFDEGSFRDMDFDKWIKENL